MSQEEREELIFICSMMIPQYSEEFLRSLTDKELIDIYNSSMNK